MAYYYNNETDAVDSLDDIRSDWEMLCAEGSVDPDEPFSYYLSGCMWWNNGVLYPLDDYVCMLNRRLAQVERSADQSNEHELYNDEIDNLTAEIAYCTSFRKE